ncbi:MAG: undecaprenyl/decaprenyl-phosphate alpha-N-acetylglucosaminyl 1-phosphate transferase [Bacteroidales bacterium]|nr:undecaprenyl/decaprenyl-phosphate alpha-N-acetylglucosaminyl 1-phosphate transferase [Bacteroidales bacterium]
MDIKVYILTFVLALAISFLLMPPFIRLMTKYRILDKSGGRKIHTGYTAHMGGIVIFIAFATSVTAMIFAYFKVTGLAQLVSFAVALLVMIIVGVRDDMNDISPWTKLFFEIIIGVLLGYLGVRVTAITGFSGEVIRIPTLISYGATICFFIVVVNAYNLIDGIDGQAGMQAINTFLFILLFFCFIVGDARIPKAPFSPMFILVCLFAILGSIVGFLRYNWQKAKIFMGDTGSLFIGTLITIFIILSMTYADAINHAEIIPSLQIKAYVAPFLGYFYMPMADTLRVFISRARKNKSPFSADKTHIHHFFIRLGYSHQRCTLTVFAISFCISVVSTVLAFFVSDFVFILIIIASWFVYVKALNSFIKRQLRRMGGGIS